MSTILSPVPGMSLPVGATNNTKYMRMYNNPFFDYLTQQLPTNHKEMFRWCELMYFSAPVIVNALKKLTSYPVTKFNFESKSEQVREDTQELVETLGLLDHLLEVGLNYYIYGNYFSSVYFPFSRFLRCNICGEEVNINDVKEYRISNRKFEYDCPHCKKRAIGTLRDRHYKSIKDIKLISWDVKQVELAMNPITGATDYFYSIPKTIRTGIIKSNPTIVNTLPSIYIDAFYQRREVKFASNFYHMKTPSISGHASGWGVSQLMPALKVFLYSAILRKSVEAIGLEHITPRRIVFPQATTTDPTVGASLVQWRQMIQRGLDMWRQDPNYTMVAPFPTGMVNIGSDGNPTLPSNEIKAAEQDMLRAIDVPVEFVYGSTNVNNTTVALRMLENQLRPLTTHYERYCNWVIDIVNAEHGTEYCHISLTPFKLLDDVMQKQLLLQSAGTVVANSTAIEALGLTPDQEREKMKQETIDQMKDQKDLELEQGNIEKDISRQVIEEEQAAAAGTIPQYQQQQLIATAEARAQEMLQLPHGPRASAMDQLQNEDFTMWAIVSKMIESMQGRGQDPHSAQAYREAEMEGAA